MGLFNKIFGGADGCRECMRESYEKHVRLAKTNSPDSPHAFGLYGALASRYMVRGWQVVEPIIWADLSPFLAMDKSEAVEALAEYAVFQERPEDARQGWLKRVINDAILSPTDNTYVAMTAMGLMNKVAWCGLLEPNTISVIENFFSGE
jgi:hypothetical protein